MKKDSPDLFFKLNEVQMKQVINHGKDGGLLNMITRPPVIQKNVAHNKKVMQKFGCYENIM